MRRAFFEYYGLNKTELAALWKNGIIVFDTNVLLSLYRRPLEVREDIVAVLNNIKSRIWIPHQVGFEFHNHRLEEANRPITAIKGLAERFCKFADEIKQVYENNPYLDYKKINTLLGRSCHSIERNAAIWLKKSPDYLRNDKILNELTDIFDGRVGEAYSEQRLLEIYKTGDERYANKIPPGYKDRKKQQGDSNRFGDLIIWYQIIDKAKLEKKDIIFVTDDEKEDWWEMYEGNKTGPCHELIREFRNNTDNRIVWFYTTERFLKEVKAREGITVKPKTIEDVKRPVIGYSSLWRQDAQPGNLSVGLLKARQLTSDDCYRETFESQPILGDIYDNKTNKPLTDESEIGTSMPVLDDDRIEATNNNFVAESFNTKDERVTPPVIEQSKERKKDINNNDNQAD